MINTWNESLLHEQLKTLYSDGSGQFEVPCEGYICDAIMVDGTIIEIQTSNLSKLSQKLTKLVMHHKVILVYPIAQRKTLVTYNPDGGIKNSRKSPKSETVYRIFREITGLLQVLSHENITLRLVFAHIIENRIADGSGSWKRKGIRITGKELKEIYGSKEFTSIADFATLLPANLEQPFTTKDLSKAGAGPHAGHMAWVLHKTGYIQRIGKKGNAWLYVSSLPVR